MEVGLRQNPNMGPGPVRYRKREKISGEAVRGVSAGTNRAGVNKFLNIGSHIWPPEALLQELKG